MDSKEYVQPIHIRTAHFLDHKLAIPLVKLLAWSVRLDIL